MTQFNRTQLKDGWVRGLPLDGPVTSYFGERDIPEHSLGHSGVDIGAVMGTPIYAPVAGTVQDCYIIGIGNDDREAVFGNHVIITDGEHVMMFAHMQAAPVVREGQRIDAGALLGHVGTTGLSTGPHLHWGMAPAANRLLDRAQGLVDPFAFIAEPAPPPRVPVWASHWGQFVWETSRDYALVTSADDMEGYAAEAARLDDELPISYIFLKCNDGQNWIRRWDSYGPASLDDVRLRIAAYNARGIGCIPWGLSYGGTQAYADGRLAGQIAAAAGHGIYMLDLEPYRGFWQAAPGAPAEFVRGFVEMGGRELWLVPDSRVQHHATIQIADWLTFPIVTRWWPQAYWTLFADGLPVRQSVAKAVQPLIDLGVARNAIFPVYMTTNDAGTVWAPAAELLEAIDYAVEERLGGCAWWRHGLTNDEQFRAMGERPMPAFPAPPVLPGPVVPVPPPPVPQPVLGAALARLNAASIEQRSATEEVIRVAGL